MIASVIRLALWLLPISILFSGVAFLTGRQLPAQDAGLDELGFAACKLPCWAEITPGLTPFDEASQILSAQFSGLRFPMYNATTGFSFEINTTSPPVSGLLYYQGNTVAEIHLYLNLPMWYLIDIQGTPSCVSVSRSGPYISLSIFWERDGLSTGTLVFFEDGSTWQPVMRTRYLQMSTTPVCDLPGMLPWLGFARAWHYEDAAIDG
jgi:hypothetical protein